ncbi:MAG: pyridoxamine 5'-phosphate oxidase family protein [Chloroflexi bacterium]|nr:pyridoxamine 5'-phosphate oxidase family protein [Chloroflexota bacterium]
MDVPTFAEIETEFLQRIRHHVYCTMATIDLKNRPRSRIMHPVWEGAAGWIISWPESPKAKHLQHNPHVSLAYFCHDTTKPVYVECTAGWMTDRTEQQRVWEFYKTVPPPLGFDPTPHYGTIDHPLFGLIKLIPWRIELCTLGGESVIWHKK